LTKGTGWKEKRRRKRRGAFLYLYCEGREGREVTERRPSSFVFQSQLMFHEKGGKRGLFGKKKRGVVFRS